MLNKSSTSFSRNTWLRVILFLEDRQINYFDRKISRSTWRAFAPEEMTRHPWFSRCSNGFRRNLNNCQMPRVALADRSAVATVWLHLLWAATPILHPARAASLLSRDVFLSLSRHFKINLSFALARRRLSIPFNLACKCRLNIFRRFTTAPLPPSSSPAVVRAALSNYFSKRGERMAGKLRGRGKGEWSRRFSEPLGGEHAGCISTYRRAREEEMLRRYRPMGFQSQQAIELLMWSASSDPSEGSP